jgi:Pyruvate/2-oxoacid:ferredoxin oxidoreductase delta subunit
MIRATIRMEARKAFIPKPWQPPMTNVMVETVNNFLDRVHSKCKDLAIYCTENIQIVTSDGDQHNLLVNYNNIKFSDVCNTIRTLHQIKDDDTKLD